MRTQVIPAPRRFLLGALVLSVAVSSCGGGESTSRPDDDEPPDVTASYRFAQTEHGVLTGQAEGSFGFGAALSEGVEESDIAAVEVRLDDGTLVMAELTARVNAFEDSDVVVQFVGDANDDFDWQAMFPVARGYLMDSDQDCLDLEQSDPVMVQLENGAEVEAKWRASCRDLRDRDGSWTLSGPVWLEGQPDGSWSVREIADE